MSADAVKFDVETARPSEVATTLRRRISALTRQDRVRAFKIGITNDPHVRWKTHKRGYDRMIVVYKSSFPFLKWKATSSPTMRSLRTT